jgi:dipeptidase D
MDIHKGRGNANKLMNRVLYQVCTRAGARICNMDGGGLRNAIPRESVAGIIVRREDEGKLQPVLDDIASQLWDEYTHTDPSLVLDCAKCDEHESVMPEEFQRRLLAAVYGCLSGIFRMSPAIEGLVQTSNNLARVQCAEGSYSIQCLTRSSVDSEKSDLATSLQAVFENMGAEVKMTGSYPGWTPAPDSGIVLRMKELYQKMFGGQPMVSACHAGLECGIIGANYPAMEMISFGPNIHGAHSPDEKVQISSVQKFWKLLLSTLEGTPVEAKA